RKLGREPGLAPGAARVPRAPRAPVRLLHARLHRARRRTARARAPRLRGARARRALLESLPLHRLHTDREGGSGGAGGEQLVTVAHAVERAIGRPLRRVEDEPLVQGRGCYVADLNRPNQVYARVVRSQVAHGRLLAVHLEDALVHEGVIGAFSAAEIPNMAETKIPIRITPHEE